MMTRNTSYFSPSELKQIGFHSVGQNVLLSRHVSVYSAKTIRLGDHVRIDDFCILSGYIEIGCHVHVGAYSALFGSQLIRIEDFAGFSSRVTVYTASDDYLGKGMTNPTIPDRYRRLTSAPVHIGQHVIVGASSVILPGVTIGTGAAIGAMSLVSRSIPPWKVASGIPAKPRIERRRDIIESFQKKLNEEARP